MLRVGLTGGYATGKSFVGAQLKQLGCHLISADKLGHEVLFPNGEAYAEVVRLFGNSILSEDKTIDRKKLGEIVFGDPNRLKQLTDIIHPAVFRREEALMNEFEARDSDGIVVIEAAILIETGRYRQFDRIILTTCDQEIQIARGMKRDHLSREQVLDRLRHQIPFEEKRQYAHHIVDTSGSKEETAEKVKEIFRELKQLSSQHSL